MKEPLANDALNDNLRKAQNFLARFKSAPVAHRIDGEEVTRLKGAARAVDLPEVERLAHDLTSGIRDLESARPAIGVMRIVNLARRDQAWELPA